METKPLSVQVEYCPTCSMPFEYCEFSNMACKNKTAPEGNAQPAQTENPEAPKPTEAEAPVKLEKGKKATGSSKIKVLLHDKKGKNLTEVSGLQGMQINAKDLSKKLCKKFGCGSGSVTADSLELQGLYKEPLIEFLIAEFKGLLSEQSFNVEEKTTKKKKGKPVATPEEDK